MTPLTHNMTKSVYHNYRLLFQITKPSLRWGISLFSGIQETYPKFLMTMERRYLALTTTDKCLCTTLCRKHRFQSFWITLFTQGLQISAPHLMASFGTTQLEEVWQVASWAWRMIWNKLHTWLRINAYTSARIRTVKWTWARLKKSGALSVWWCLWTLGTLQAMGLHGLISLNCKVQSIRA